ncbi:TPM domain-containing protein [Desulfobulbus sp. F4]|nr:TPM domain-containing protein [Desulfobulbus sp. F3]MCW5200221.1 TPM domain-containing protein [Desulfobulbus sp. F4]
MKLRISVPHHFELLVLLCLLLVPIALRAASPAVPSSPPERVVDLANIIEPALEAQLVSALRELEEKTTAQMVVLTVSSLDGETIETVSLRTFMQWKLGQKGKDNGLLLTVALKERKYRFEAGLATVWKACCRTACSAASAGKSWCLFSKRANTAKALRRRPKRCLLFLPRITTCSSAATFHFS